MEIEKLFFEWMVAYRAKGGRLTIHGEELFADFFRWLKSKAAEQSVQSDECPHCHAKPAYTDQQTYPDICSECGTRR